MTRRLLQTGLLTTLVAGCYTPDPASDKGNQTAYVTTPGTNDTDTEETGSTSCPECDVDGDGHDAIDQGGDDCDDNNALVNPSADELCDGIDNDCDTLVDDGDFDIVGGTIFYFDSDRDGYGNEEASDSRCEANDTYVDNADDCNDNDAFVNPAATEVCNTVDDNCDGLADDDDPNLAVTSIPTHYPDLDLDGYGDGTQAGVTQCLAPGGDTAPNGTDCDDTDALINPGVDEIICDTFDNDCNPLTVDNDPSDADSDGFTICQGDCDDLEPTTNPNGVEVQCDGADNDCDPLTEESPDGDGDGVGVCEDCDDTNVNGTYVAGWVPDADGDGAGVGTATAPTCLPPGPGYAPDSAGEDCDDGDPTIHPAALEICDDGIDNDCEGTDQPCDTAADYGLRGTADVVPGDHYIGTESYHVTGTASGVTLCEWTWSVIDWESDATTAGPPPITAACTDIDGNACDFSFTLNLSLGGVTDGDCDDFIDTTTYPTSIDEVGYGFTEDYQQGGIGYGPFMMYYEASTAEWLLLEYAWPVSFEPATDTFEYDWWFGELVLP